MVRKLALPFPLLSDARGDLIKHCGLWNEEEGVSEPAIVVLDRYGTVRHLYSGGGDFSDRPTLDQLFELLEEIGAEEGSDGEAGGEPEFRVLAGEAEDETVRPDNPPLTLEQLQPYYLGTYFATLAMQKKIEALGSKGEKAKERVDAYQGLVNEYNAAITETAEQEGS